MDFDVRQRRCKSRLPFGCKHCTRRFSRVNELQLHNKRHKKPPPKDPGVVTSATQDQREPIPKMVIRRNSSPIKRNGNTSSDVVEYEIVDLTADDTQSESEQKVQVQTSLLPKPTVISLCSPSQKDSGIDDSSPQSCDEVRDSAEAAKASISEPIYSPYIGVDKHTCVVDNHNSIPSNSCDTCVDNSQSSPRGCSGNVVKTLDDQKITSSGSGSFYTVQLPSVTQVNAGGGGNGFITIDLDHLSKIVGAGSVTDSQGNISVTLEPNSEASRNIFDAIAKSGSVHSDEYVPSPKKPRRSSDFDTGDSQFNFYDSNQVEAVPVVSRRPASSDTETDTDVMDDYSGSKDAETSFEKESTDDPAAGNAAKQQLYNYYLNPQTRCDSDLSAHPDYDTDSNSQTTIEYGDQIALDASYDQQNNFGTCVVPNSVNTHLESRVHFEEMEDEKASFKQVQDSSAVLSSWSLPKDDSPSKYQNEFAKFLSQRTSPPKSQQSKRRSDSNKSPVETINSCVTKQTRSADNIFDNFMPRSTVKKVKVKLEDGEDLPTITPVLRVPVKQENRVREEIFNNAPSPVKTQIQVKVESPQKLANVEDTRDASGPKGPFQSRRSIRAYCKYREKLVNLRRQTVCLLHVLFPKLEYPSYFKSSSICVDVLLDEIVALLQVEPKTGKIRTLQSIPLENACCDARVLVCPLSALTCLRNFRRKVCKFLQHVLPQLQLNSSFQRTGENVDELLYQVIECNSPR